MKVTAKIVANFEDEGKLKAIATVCLDGRFLVTGVRIVDCKKGLVVFMPSRKTEDGSYANVPFAGYIAFPSSLSCISKSKKPCLRHMKVNRRTNRLALLVNLRRANNTAQVTACGGFSAGFGGDL